MKLNFIAWKGIADSVYATQEKISALFAALITFISCYCRIDTMLNSEWLINQKFISIDLNRSKLSHGNDKDCAPFSRL